MNEKNAGKLLVYRQGDAHVIEFIDASILDQTNIDQIKDELMSLIDRTDNPHLVIDFAHVELLSSAALGVLIAANQRVKQQKGKLRLCGISSQLIEVFQLTRLDKQLDIFQTKDEALARFA